MLKTILDYQIFKDFFVKAPKSIKEGGTVEENKYWNSLWEYLKSGTQLSIVNFPNIDNVSDIDEYIKGVCRNLYSNKNKASKSITENFKKPHKCKFPKSQDIHTVFLLDEKYESEKVKYRKNNGFIFGFIDDYDLVWKEISFLNKESVLHDRKSVKDDKRFTWDKFSEFLLPFTDVIIRDDFLFINENEIETKFGSIINALLVASNTKFNILIIVNKYKMDKRFEKDLDNLHTFIEKEYLSNSSIENIGFVHTAKEHDRYVFFNYLEVDFGKMPDDSSVPTKISFFPYTINSNSLNAKIILDDIGNIVNNSIDNKEFAGNCNNRLIKIDSK